jgi:hypothetical protein
MGADLDFAIEARASDTSHWRYVLGTYLALRGPITDLFEEAGVDPTEGTTWAKYCRDYDRRTLSGKTVDLIGRPPEADPPYWVRVIEPEAFARIRGTLVQSGSVPAIVLALDGTIEILHRETDDEYRVVVWYGQ